MKKFLFIISLSIVFFAVSAVAADKPEVNYPIPELGNCASQEECRMYCNETANREQCWVWAEKNGLARKNVPKNVSINSPGSREEERLAEEALANAPGGCISPRECDAYCRIEEHLDECLDYSVKYGYSTAEDAEKIRGQARRGGPGGCKSEGECDSYCRNPENVRECMNFVVEEGKITQEEAEFMIEQMSSREPAGKPTGKGPAEPKIKEEKIKAILKQKTGPGGCSNMRECAAYCQNFEHMDECMKFAEENQIMEPQEMEKAKRLGSMAGPGGCKGPAECDAFCSKHGNGEICFKFAKENGLLAEEEIQMMEKQMSIIKKLDREAGPGGCRSKEECSAYCNDPSKLEECINFAGKTGMMNPDAVKQMMGQTEGAKEKMRDLERYRTERTMDEAGGPNGDMPQGGGGDSRGFMNFFNKQQSPMNTPNQQTQPSQFVPNEGNMPVSPEGIQVKMPTEGSMPNDMMQKSPEGNYYDGPLDNNMMPPQGFEGHMPPDGMMSPEGFQGEMPPNSMMQSPPEGNYYGPPDGGMMAPPEGFQGEMPPQEIISPEPTSFNFFRFLGAAISSIFGLLK